MLYLFYGPGPKKSKIKKLLEKFDGEVITVTDLDFNEGRLEELVSAQSLFMPQLVVVFDNVASNKESEKIIEKFLDDLAPSRNIFVFSQDDISPSLLLPFREQGEVFLSELKKEARPAFNIFNLTDAFGRRDKKKAWLFFLEAVNQIMPEEIAQMLFWQIKSMTLVKRAKNAASLGLNPYVLKKASASSQNFSPEELKHLSNKLVAIFHESRRGGPELDVSLEKFILESL